ncbi:MAG TPA: amidohydrolase/deacetylase family metallohydrolase [Candidatus Baltobacteraceae bacterium]|nr:amidohydrolase/deacetylase family metallohydrolase [Candidatus Baltobacteraceae bacterium]
MDFDLVIKHGDVVDPGSNLLGRLDIGIRDGVIAAVDRSIPTTGSSPTLDAAGQVVTPGLFDMHTHVYWGATYWGIEPDPIAARTGVTTWLDAGTAGGYSFPGFRRTVVEGSEARIFALLNVSAIGLVAPTYEVANLDYCDLALARQIVDANRDVLLGIKARIDALTTRGVGLEPLRLARKLADQVALPLMVHIGKGPPTLEEIFTLLRPGDILTHCCTGQANRLPDPDGRLPEFVRRAWQEGLILDLGHGTGSFSYEAAEQMLAAGLPPDIISSDIHQLSVQGPMFDLPTTLSKFLNLGMTLPEVIERATARPARAVRRPDLATLRPGTPADIALFALEEGDYTFHDVFMTPRAAKVRLVNRMTLRAGKPLTPLPARPLAPWAVLPEAQRIQGKRAG